MRTAILAVAAIGFLAATTGAEACSNGSFAGLWRIQVSTGVSCAAQGLKTGVIAKSYCVVGRTYVGTIGGRLHISKGCRITGSIRQNFKGAKQTSKIAGSMKANGSSMRGHGSGRLGSFTFIAVKVK